MATGWGAGDLSSGRRDQSDGFILYPPSRTMTGFQAGAGQWGHQPCVSSLDAADVLDFWESFWYFKGDLPSKLMSNRRYDVTYFSCLGICWFKTSFWMYFLLLSFYHFSSKSIRLTNSTEGVMNWKKKKKSSPSFLDNGIMILAFRPKLLWSFQATYVLCVLVIKIWCTLKAIPASCDVVIKIISALNTSFPSCQLWDHC